jgi:hypothetical protein
MDQDDLKRVQDMLSDLKGLPERVTIRALNKTLTGVRTDASSAIREVITPKKAAVDATFKLEKASSGANIMAWPKNRKLVYARLPKKFRFPIQQRFGPRVSDIMGNDPVMKIILDKAEVRLHDNLEHETDFELSKYK